MSEKGVFAMDRGWFDHPFFAKEPFTEREAWAWLISEAAWRPKKVRVGREIVSLERGDVAHSSRFMAKKWGWSRSKVTRFIVRLIKHEMAWSKTGPEATHLTICKYNQYQRVSLPTGPEPDQNRTKEEDIKDIKGRGGDARAPDTGSISPEAFALSDEFLTAIGVDPKAPELNGMAGTPYVAQMWLTRGYERALILATAAEVSARHGAIKPLVYYTKCLETAHSKRPVPGQRNLPLLATINGGSNENHRRSRTSGSAITAAIDAHVERFEREACAEREIREAPPRVLSGG